MDYSNKWVIGFGTLPFIICSILFSSVAPNIHVAFIALFSCFVSTIPMTPQDAEFQLEVKTI